MPRGTSRLDEARLQGRLWAPQLMSPVTLAAWYDAGDLSTLTGSSGNITQIRDKSGNARHLFGLVPYSQSALSYSPGTTGARPGLVFAAGAHPITSATCGTASIISGFAVAQFNAAGTYLRVISLQPTSGAADFNGGSGCDLLSSGSGGIGGLISYDNANLGSVTFRDTTMSQPHVMVSYNDGVNHTMYADGAPGTPVAYAPAAKTPFIALGASTGGNDGQLTGVISEALVTYGNVSQYRQKIEGYLAWKWGLVDQLNPAHPYKNRPPTIGG